MEKSRIATHPGEILREEFMLPNNMNASALARALDVPGNWIADITAVECPTAITPDIALRLARYFRTTPQFWLNLQQAHVLSAAVATRGAS